MTLLNLQVRMTVTLKISYRAGAPFNAARRRVGNSLHDLRERPEIKATALEMLKDFIQPPDELS